MLFSADMENRIKHLRKKAGLTTQGLADLVGTSNQQIGYLERGERSLTQKWMDRISAALGVAPADLLPPKTVQVVGYAGAGAVVYGMDDHAKGTGMFEISAPPQGATPTMVALVIRGDSMSPAYDDGDVVYYDETASGPDLVHLVGKKCVVRLADGSTFLKRLRRDGGGSYWLESFNGDPILNPQIEWAAVVLFTKQRD